MTHDTDTMSNSRHAANVYTGPDSVMVRASASGAGDRGFNNGPRQSNDVKMVPVATLLGAQHS